MSRTKMIAACLAGLLCTRLAVADPTADPGADYQNSARIGSYTVFYHTHADDVSGPFVTPGVNIDNKNLETLYLAYVRSLPWNLQAELTFGWPPLAQTRGKGPAMLGSVPYNGQTIAEARWFAPTALLEYVFLEPSAPLRPFVGIGATYVSFYDRTVTPAGEAAIGGPTKLSLSTSFGPAATLGLDWRVASRFHLYASYSWAQVKSDLAADTDGIIRRTRVSFGPQALIVSAGLSF